MDLQDRSRPVPGGVQTEVDIVCTVTANAYVVQSEAWGFLTNSHCTSYYGFASGEAAYQHVNGVGNVIGWELVDPALWSPGWGLCPSSSAGCRYTDAAFFAYESDTLADGFTLARTMGSNGSRTVNPNIPRFVVAGASPSLPYVGMEVHKIGRTTGWTVGEVTGTCVYREPDEDGIGRLCNAVTDLDAAGGDSGSPVFVWDGSASWVVLVGILWGGVPYTEMVYNPYVYIQLEIESELGSEVVYGNGN